MKYVLVCFLFVAATLLAAFSEGGTFIPVNTNAASLPINLAGGSGVVTGTLPAGNQASQTMGGDISGTTGAATVQAISGSTPIVITPAVLQWSASTVTPKIAQSSPITDVATTNLIVQSQAPNAGAVTHVSPGNIALTLPAPVSGDGAGNSGYVSVTDGSTDVFRFGYGLNSNSLQSTILAPNALPLTIQSNGSYVHLIGVGNSYIDADSQAFRSSNGGSTFATLTSSSLALTPPLALGTGTVAAAGSVRAGNNTTVLAARNAGNSADLPLVRTDSSNNVNFGDDTVSATTSLRAHTTAQVLAANVTGILVTSSSVGIENALFMTNQTTASTATAGANGAVPAQVSNYLVITINSTNYKIPLYNP